MFRIRTRKIWGDIWARKVRTLLAATSIFIGVFGVVSLSSAGEILVRQLEKDLQAEQLAMLRSLVVAKRDVTVDNAAMLETLRQQPEVTAVEARAIYPVYWHLPDEDTFREGTIAAHSEPFAESDLEPLRLLEGRFPADAETAAGGDTVEIVIERRMADEYGLGVGDTIVLRELSQAQQNGVQTLTGAIVGIVFQPYGYPGFGGVVTPDQLIMASYPDVQRIAGSQGFSAIYARFTDFAAAEAQQQSFTNAIATTAYIPTYTTTEDPANNSNIESARSTSNLLVILALTALVVSGFLIINVINGIVVEQRRQIGLLKSLGASGGDNFFIYAGIAFTYGLLGVIPGVILGIPAGYVFAQVLATQSQTVIDTFTVSPVGLALGVFLGLGVPVIASLLPVLNGIRVGILDAMTDFGIDATFGESRLDRFVGRLPLPLAMRQAVRNAYQKKTRLFLTGLTLTLASAAFMGVFAVFYELAGIVEEAFDRTGYEILITPNESQDFDRLRTLLLDNIDGIASIDPSVSLAVDVEGFDPPPVQAGPPGLFVQGFNTENPNIINLDLVDGTAWQDDPTRDGVVLSTSIADALRKQTGDEVTLTVSGNQRTFEIIGVAQTPSDVVYMNWRQLASFGGLVNANGEPYPNAVNVTMADDNPSSREVDDMISRINETLLANGISASFTNQVGLAELITQIVAAFGVILSLAALLIAMVGAVGLLTTLSMSVFERQKEIGVMRSVGAGSGVIMLQFLAEGLIVGMVAWLLASPISLGVSRVLIDVLPFGGTYDIGYPASSLVVGLVGMIVLVGFASLVPSWSAARKTVSDILRYQ